MVGLLLFGENLRLAYAIKVIDIKIESQ